MKRLFLLGIFVAACRDSTAPDFGPCAEPIAAEQEASPNAEMTVESQRVQFYFAAEQRWVWYSWETGSCVRTEAQV